MQIISKILNKLFIIIPLTLIWIGISLALAYGSQEHEVKLTIWKMLRDTALNTYIVLFLILLFLWIKNEPSLSNFLRLYKWWVIGLSLTLLSYLLSQAFVSLSIVVAYLLTAYFRLPTPQVFCIV